VPGPRAEEPASRIRTDLCQQLVEGDELAGALAHGRLDAVPNEAHPGDEQPPNALRIEAHGDGRRPVASDSPVVVLAPEVDQLLEATAELLGQVADVRGEIRGLAVGPIDRSEERRVGNGGE